MRISLKQLSVFAAIAKQGNMTLAAKKLSLTQSACSMALMNLENQLNGTLFTRNGKRLLLNTRGRLIYPKIINILAQAKELEELMINDQEDNPVGHLIVGASSTIGNYLMPIIIGNFSKKNQQAHVNLRIANSEQIIQQLLTFEIDIGIIEGHCTHTELKCISWHQDELVLIASPKHEINKKNKITIADLHAFPWILREMGSGTRQYVEAAIGKQPNIFLELGHTEAIKQAVKAGLGISCLSRLTVQDALKTGELIEVKVRQLKIMRQFYILLHHEKYRSNLLKTFIKTGLDSDAAV